MCVCACVVRKRYVGILVHGSTFANEREDGGEEEEEEEWVGMSNASCIPPLPQTSFYVISVFFFVCSRSVPAMHTSSLSPISCLSMSKPSNKQAEGVVGGDGRALWKASHLLVHMCAVVCVARVTVVVFSAFSFPILSLPVLI